MLDTVVDRDLEEASFTLLNDLDDSIGITKHCAQLKLCNDIHCASNDKNVDIFHADTFTHHSKIPCR